MVVKNITIESYNKHGSSMPVTAADENGVKYIVKMKGSGEGLISSISEWVAGNLADMLGLPVIKPVFVNIDKDTKVKSLYDELDDLIVKSHGTNIGFPYIENAEPYDRSKHESIFDRNLLDLILLFDMFILNIDRRENNTNLLVADDKIYSLDYGVSLLIKCILFDIDFKNNRQMYKEMKRNPLYHDKANPEELISRFAKIPFEKFVLITNRIPDEWFTGLELDVKESKTKLREKLWNALTYPSHIFTITRLLRETEADSEEVIRQKQLANKGDFIEKYLKNWGSNK